MLDLAGTPASSTLESASPDLLLRRISTAGAVVAITLAVLALAGWVTHVPILAAIVPGMPAIRVNAALVAGGLGIAALLVRREDRGREVGALLALACATFSAITLAQWPLGIDLGIDNALLAPALEEPGTAAPGRMAAPAAVAFVLLGLATVARGERRLVRRSTEVLALVAGLIAVAVMIGQGFGVASLLTFGSNLVALPASLAVLGLAISLIASRSGHRISATLTSDGPAGRTVRRSIPLLFGIPILGGIALAGFVHGLYEASIGVAIAVVAAMVWTGAIVSWAARHVHAYDTAAQAVRRERDRFFDLSSDLIVVVDRLGQIRFVSSAWTRILGHPTAEAVGGSILAFLPESEHAAIWDRFASDHRAVDSRFPIEVPMLHADGSTRLVEWAGTLDGASDSIYAVGRDVTDLRRTEAHLARAVRERGEVAAALARLPSSGDLVETATALCRELRSLDGVDVASVIVFGPEETTVLAVDARADLPITAGRSIPAGRSAHLHALAGVGPWSEEWTATSQDGPAGRAITDAGVRAMAYAPIRNGHGPLGLLEIGTTNAEYAKRLLADLPIVHEFAAAATALLGPGIDGFMAEAGVRTRIDRLIDGKQFHPVFQPIVDFATARAVGYEALTRFHGDRRPDLVFADAAAVGLGVRLEVETLRAAVAAARELPAGTWLNLNVSPGLLVDRVALRDAIGERDRPVVIEVTEHEQVRDYEQLRAAMETLGPGIRLAVDDAGAGAANFSHIVQLRPDFVKLDIGLVRGINADLTRQALVVGLRHFAQNAGCRLIAEGIETAAEADTLAAFGVELGQGFWLGRPAPVEAFLPLVQPARVKTVRTIRARKPSHARDAA